MNQNDVNFIKTITDLKAVVFNEQKYLKEKYGVDSEFNEDALELHIKSNSVNECLNCAVAAEYFKTNHDLSFIDIVYDNQ